MPSTQLACAAVVYLGDEFVLLLTIQDDANTQAFDPTRQTQFLMQMSIPPRAADDAVTARVTLDAGCAA